MTSHDLPPPPYSETDIYSHSGHSPLIRNSSPAAGDDDASIAASSSHSNIIYTPPETPRGSTHSFGSRGDDENDHITDSSAQAYFESRPAPRTSPFSTSPEDPLLVSIIVPDGATPQALPYPAWAATHDTTPRDWQTFVNYLLPDHAARSNEHLVARKLDAEANGDALSSSPSGRDMAHAQLRHLNVGADASNWSHRRQNVQDTIHAWNAGFFGPRGVEVQLGVAPASATITPEPGMRIPGAWEEPSESWQSTPGGTAPATGNESQQGHQQQSEQQTRNANANIRRSRWNPFEISGNRVRIGPLAIDGDRVTIGNSFQADSRGVRWNGQSIGGGGGSFAGLTGIGTRPDHTNDPSHREERRGRGFGCGRGGLPGNFSPFGFEHIHQPHGFGAQSHHHTHAHNWNPQNQQHHHYQDPIPQGGRRHRSRSASSVSSSSSIPSSNSESDSSIGSLPDWDDLNDAQLPVVRQSVAAWLAHPEQPITRGMLKAAKANIKAAKRGPPSSSAQPAVSSDVLRHDIRVLLQQFKGLKAQQRGLRQAERQKRRAERKAERTVHRAERKVRRTVRRAERREQKTLGRELRRAEKDIDRTVRRSGGCDRPGRPCRPCFPAMQAVPPMPHMPNMPAMPVPPRPHIPGPRPVLGPGRSGGPGFFGGRDGPFTGGDDRRGTFAGRRDAQRQHTTPGTIPGAWPPPPFSPANPAQQQQQHANEGAFTPAPSRTAKYEEADRLEAKLVCRADELRKLQEQVEREQIEAAKRGDGDRKDQQRGGSKREDKSKSVAQTTAETLEGEVDQLGRDIERLRFEADEEFARALAEEERRG